MRIWLVVVLVASLFLTSSVQGLEQCSGKEIGIGEKCIITVWAWNQSSNNYVSTQNVVINISYPNGSIENASLMINSSYISGLHNFTYLGSTTPGYRPCIITSQTDTFIPEDCSFTVNESTQTLIQQINVSIPQNITTEHGTGLYNSSGGSVNATANVNTSAIADAVWDYNSTLGSLVPTMGSVLKEIYLILIGGFF